MMEMGQPTQETTKSQRNYFLKVPVVCKLEIKSDNSYLAAAEVLNFAALALNFTVKFRILY